MGAVTAPPTRPAAPGIDACLALDPARPLYVRHVGGPLTLTVVSIAWLRGIGARSRAVLESRHLGTAESEQAQQLRLPKRRLEWLAGRLALKHGVCAYQRRHFGTRAVPRDVRVGAVADGLRAGKPQVDFPVEVGLSHSVDFAVAACGPRAVGIDVECVRRMPPMVTELLTTAPGVARAAESVRVRAMSPSLRWACTEAVLKHFGVGLRVDVREVELTDWRPDGRFSWRAGPGLRRLVPEGDGTPFDSWARDVDGYSVALVWR
jgi:4'-phosphopantetheinyl transferase